MKPTDSKQQSGSTGKFKVSHPGMMGDGTEEQNLNQQGDASARITEGDVKAAFSKDKPKA